MRKIILCLCVSAFMSSLRAQPYTNLVLEGGGIRGIAYAGAIRVLEEKQMLGPIEKVGGTSAGAIAALAISLGYNSNDLEVLISDTKIQKFNDGRFFFIGGISRMNRNYGWYRGEAFTEWLEDIIEKKTDNADITFYELHQRKFKDLYVTGTSLNNQKLLEFSWKTYPQMKVKDAVRISMSIPLYFEAVFIDSLGHVKSKNEISEKYDLVVDGGFTGNFPVAMFDSVVHTNGIKQRFANPHTLGLRIDTPEQIGYDSLAKGLAPIPIARFKNYVGAFYSYVIENLNRNSLTKEDWERTASISSGSIGPKIKKLSAEEKRLLVDNGYRGLKKFLETRK